MSSFIAAGTAYANLGVNMVPFYFYYSMFGFQRIGDRRDHIRARDPLFLFHVFEDGKDFAAHMDGFMEKKSGPKAHFLQSELEVGQGCCCVRAMSSPAPAGGLRRRTGPREGPLPHPPGTVFPLPIAF